MKKLQYSQNKNWIHFSQENHYNQSPWAERYTQIARFMWPTWGPPGSWPHVGPTSLTIRAIIVKAVCCSDHSLIWMLSHHRLQSFMYLVHIWYIPLAIPQTLTHQPLDKMATISQTTFSNTFSWMKKFEFWLKFHWRLFLRDQLTITQHWSR